MTAKAAAPITEIEIRRLKLELIKPYRLSFGTQYAFDTLLVILRDKAGGEGFAESTLLTGYTDETIEESWTNAGAWAPEVADKTPDEIRALLRPRRREAPFTASAFLAALDVLTDHVALRTEAKVPILAILSTDGQDAAAAKAEIDRHIAAGYTTLKFKVGFEVEKDLAGLANVQKATAGRALIRVDANQGYSVADAVRFLERMDPKGVELIEQPCDKDDWDAAVKAKRASRAPYMLDESIYDERDIEKAAKLEAADIIKLKLMKLGGIDDLTAALARIRALGMRPVCGNGVATDLGCWLEAAAMPGLVDNAGEMNGFLKPHVQLLIPRLAMEGPAIVLDGKARRLDMPAVESVTVATARYVSPVWVEG